MTPELLCPHCRGPVTEPEGTLRAGAQPITDPVECRRCDWHGTEADATTEETTHA